MSPKTIGVGRSTPNRLSKIDAPETWGSLRRFMRVTGLDEVDAVYWITFVWRPAHRMSHPFLNIERCPGCVFEAVAEAEAA